MPQKFQGQNNDPFPPSFGGGGLVCEQRSPSAAVPSRRPQGGGRGRRRRAPIRTALRRWLRGSGKFLLSLVSPCPFPRLNLPCFLIKFKSASFFSGSSTFKGF